MKKTTGTLKRIITSKKALLEQDRRAYPVSYLRDKMESALPPIGFAASLSAQSKRAVIAEMKRASPSAGIMKRDLNPVETAVAYCKAGAAAISVLTEENHFYGSLEDLTKAKDVSQTYSVPVLRKDFIFTSRQLLEARAAGADAVLLIMAVLESSECADLTDEAREMGMDVLMEVHDEQEMTEALELEVDILGINNRNLKTLQTRLENFECLAPLVPSSIMTVAESGIKNANDAMRMFDAGADAILVGESLMKQSCTAFDFIQSLKGY